MLLLQLAIDTLKLSHSLLPRPQEEECANSNNLEEEEEEETSKSDGSKLESFKEDIKSHPRYI
jgi:hypothetical protein